MRSELTRRSRAWKLVASQPPFWRPPSSPSVPRMPWEPATAVRILSSKRPTPELAEEIGKLAEVYRHDLAIEWLGKAMPNWAQPCPIHAQVEPQLGAGGATSFVFDHGEVFGWRMEIQGSHERVLDSVLPHEVTHTIFATPLPPPVAALGRRRGLHHGRTHQRANQARSDADSVPAHRPRHRVSARCSP